ncbi:sigma 54 modulation/S30EA ribosomal C-terminal domain-containing protein [Actinomycetospora lutea]|uniref:sigma 54 modulation/S30EA ribosomal C-terminal domain-containing protein n=1 Tax=Actinomycetospora lutea TaxID=663604 RepID=UPI0023669333|nr:sigma 54 modulation/S30EA ribosomal C-terminal domain-containing protein [Actinomycetospora lutea]MDD7939564.1 sigma 54 modulation/S30EA ribosomal C-terminal domain-containing protein [Actinomycetospora lutea]
MTSPHRPPATRVPPPVVELRGMIGTGLAEYAREKVVHALDHGVHPVGPARVRIVRHDDPARERPVVAIAHVDLAGRRLHAHVVAATPREAVDLLVDRLRRQVGDAHARAHPRRAGAPDPAAVDGTIDRHDVVLAVPTSVPEAVAIMEDREEAFHLFVERSSGRRAVVYRGGPTGRRVAVDDGSAPEPPGAAGTTVSARAARTTGPEGAVEHLRLGALPFLFFHDPAVGRARVVHLDERGRTVLVDVETGPAPPAPEPRP